MEQIAKGHRTLSREEQRNTRVVTAVCYVFLMSAAVGFFTTLLADPARSDLVVQARFSLTQAGIGAVVLLLNTNGYHLSARVFLAIAYCVFSVFMGTYLDLHYFMVLAPLVVFLATPRRQFVPAVLTSVAILSIYLLAEWSVLPAISVFRLSIPEATGQQLNHSSLMFASTAVGMIVARVVGNSETAIELARQKSDSLLRRVFPDEIAERLKAGETNIADRIESATVLFADVVGFTEFADATAATEVVDSLDRLFRAFDAIARELHVEKIKTIGDAYMAAAGVPEPVNDGEVRMVELALRMQRVAGQIFSWPGLALRVGVSTGPVVAGVIGESRFVYDLWGDTVNVASRMESHGIAGEVHITAEVARAIADKYAIVPRGSIEIKGKGMMSTFTVHRHPPTQ